MEERGLKSEPTAGDRGAMGVKDTLLQTKKKAAMLKRPQSNKTCIYRLLFCCCPTVKISQMFQVTDVKKGVHKSMHRPAIVYQQSDRVIIIL